jgi:hypothetical protein
MGALSARDSPSMPIPYDGSRYRDFSPVSLLDQRMDIGVAGHALRIGVLGEGAEALAERLVVGVRQLALAAKVNHLVAEQCVANLRELLGAHRGNLNADNFRAHSGRERPDSDMPIFGRAIIELTRRMQVHVSEP